MWCLWGCKSGTKWDNLSVFAVCSSCSWALFRTYMVGQFGTAFVGLGQDCAREYAGKVFPTPCWSLAARTGMGRRPSRVGCCLDCLLVLQVTGLPSFPVISSTPKQVVLILGRVFPAFSSLPSFLVHNCSAWICRSGDCSSQLACPLSIPGHIFMVPFPPTLIQILSALWSHHGLSGHFPRHSPCSLQTLLAVSVEVASCPWWLFSQGGRH